ncbi:hypothetical protein PJF56_01065 [Roseofilum sp. BLCC_M91]|uniref:DUF3278 domain-containing protein n=1 Tax=Roseofilum halophilum BLCC-M91 TaxID=3022259 RepID=A0ABT7BGN7_9CYAN|nr:hypothetical protein [Roseofilum halophilum]MDJ1177443.1 hypothetical protein [Roseofilum halophilum BLCC-M91]
MPLPNPSHPPAKLLRTDLEKIDQIKAATEAEGIKQSKHNRPKNIVGKPIWYIILSIYAILLTFTGFVTFFHNNGFASRKEHIEQLDLIATPEELEIYRQMIDSEVENIGAINNMANQAFNVVLGSLLGFLSATLTTLDSDENDF